MRLLVLALAGCASQPATDHSKHHDHRFTDAEEWAKRFDDPSRDAWQKPEEVVRLMAIQPGMTVVDLGAGTGYFLPHLSKAVGSDGKVLALDVEQSMVDYMTKRAAAQGMPNVEARVVAPDDPGLAEASVDRILIVNTWHHLPDRDQYAKKLAAALSERGEIWIVDFTKESPIGPPAEFRFQADEVQQALAPLTAAIVEESLPNQFIVRAGRP